jgi:Na+/H+ antiporter NhaD/arsenite permease-like protein
MPVSGPGIDGNLPKYPNLWPGKWSRSTALALLEAATVAILLAGERAGFLIDWRQVASLAVFCGLLWGILLFEDHRLLVSSTAVAAVVGLGLFSSVHQLIASAGLDVIFFLLGTFLVAGYLEENLFFEHLAGQIVGHVGSRPAMLMGVLMLSAMVASAIVGEVAAILFVGGAMLHIAQRYKLQPIPFLIMLVFATNTGSAASPFGPVGVTIALKANLAVFDFLRWATPIAIAVLGLVFVICRGWFAADWASLAAAVYSEDEAASVLDPGHRRSQSPAWLLICAMVLLFLFHTQIENAVGLGPNRVLLAAALLAGGLALILAGRRSKAIIQSRVDWRTLAFFMCLFIIVGSLEATKVTNVIARQLMRASGGQPGRLVLEMGWGTGFLSGLIDNLMAVATALPVIAHIKADGTACPTAIYWMILFGGTFMGNMTSIGSTCNIIACGMADKRGHGTIYFRSWLKIGIIISLASMALATLLLAVQTEWLTAG